MVEETIRKFCKKKSNCTQNYLFVTLSAAAPPDKHDNNNNNNKVGAALFCFFLVFIVFVTSSHRSRGPSRLHLRTLLQPERERDHSRGAALFIAHFVVELLVAVVEAGEVAKIYILFFFRESPKNDMSADLIFFIAFFSLGEAENKGLFF